MKDIKSKLFLLLLYMVLGSTVLYGQEQKKRVAVMDFDYGTVQHWWEGTWDVGKGIADLIVDQMVKDGTYSVVERKKLSLVLAEQDFSNSSRVDSGTASKIGKILGANVIVVGSITQFGTEKKKFNVGGVFGKFPGLGGGNIGTSQGKAKVGITARFIDVNTGEILASASGLGESKRSGVALSGIGSRNGGFGSGGVDMNSSDFRQTIIGEATYKAVDELTKQLIDAGNKVPTTKVELQGMVADVSSQSVILNIGKTQNLKPGSILKVLRIVRVVKDPANGKVLREIIEEVGQVRVDDVEDDSSNATIMTGKGIKVGDLVKGL